MVSSSRQLDWMWWSRRSHASEMSYRSSPDGVGHNPSSPCYHVLPTFPMPLDALECRQSAPTETRRDHPLPPMAFYRAAATTHLALHSLPSFQRRGSPDSWRVDDAPCRPRRPKVSGRADEQR